MRLADEAISTIDTLCNLLTHNPINPVRSAHHLNTVFVAIIVPVDNKKNAFWGPLFHRGFTRDFAMFLKQVQIAFILP